MSGFPGPWGSLLVGSWLVHGYLHGHLDFSVWKTELLVVSAALLGTILFVCSNVSK